MGSSWVTCLSLMGTWGRQNSYKSQSEGGMDNPQATNIDHRIPPTTQFTVTVASDESLGLPGPWAVGPISRDNTWKDNASPTLTAAPMVPLASQH